MSKKACFIIIFFMLFISNASTIWAANIIQNPNFQQISNDSAVYWHKKARATMPSVTDFRLDQFQGHSDKTSICIINNVPNYARYLQEIQVESDSDYKLSCWIKTENVGAMAKGASIAIEGTLYSSRDIKGTTANWQYVELYVHTGVNQNTFTVSLELGGYTSFNMGKAWFDDVEVENIDCIPAYSSVLNLEGTSVTDNTMSDNFEEIRIKFLTFLICVTTASLIFILLSSIAKRRRILSDLNNTDSKTDIPVKGFRSRTVKFFKKLNLDFFAVTVLTIVYLFISLCVLGTSSVPRTAWIPTAVGESHVIAFDKAYNIDKVMYYCSSGTGNFKIEYTDESGNLLQLAEEKIKQGDYYHWSSVETDINTDSLTITAQSKDTRLSEMYFGEKGSAQPIACIEIVASAGITGITTIHNLFDEQNIAQYDLSHMSNTYFDEIFFVRTAYEHINGIEPYETTHPPLGKLIISIGILIFGMNPFGWRIMGTLFGAAMIPLMYLFGLKLFKNKYYAYCAAFLTAFDFMHFTHTRIATVDSFTVFFIILAYFFMYDYFSNKSYIVGFKRSLKPLLFAGIAFGLGSACKWIAIYSAPGIALLFILAKYGEIKDYIEEKATDSEWVQKFFSNYVIKTCAYCMVFFIIIPLIIYLFSYVPFVMIPGPAHNFEEFVSYQRYIFNWHGGFKRPHKYASPWWSWPLMLRPLWLFSASGGSGGIYTSSIVSMGNPAIWWIGIFAVCTSIQFAISRKDKYMIVPLTAIATQLLPWAFIQRSSFIYHFSSVVPFVILCIVYRIKCIIETWPKMKYVVNIYLTAVFLLFVMFYPILSGLTVHWAYIEYALRWFKFWKIYG